MLRLALPPDATDDDIEESVTVAEAARRLGCATSTVRALLETGDISGHRVGKCGSPRGVRVHAVAIRTYKARHTLGSVTQPANDQQPGRARSVHNPAGAEARRRLRALGVL